MGSWGMLNLTAYAYSRSIDGVIMRLSVSVRIMYTDLLFFSPEDYELLYTPGLCHCHAVGIMWSARRALILLPTYTSSK